MALLGTCAVLSAAGLWSVLGAAPAPAPAPRPVSAATIDDEARSVAEAFARTYLTWDEANPASRRAALRQLAPVLADDLSSEQLVGEQSVRWSTVARDERTAGGRRITVMAETTEGPVALTVSLRRDPDGTLVIGEPPALVGPPVVSSDANEPGVTPLSDDALAEVATRALENYLAQRADPLSADLLPGSTVVVPEQPLRLSSVEDVAWTAPKRELRAVVVAETSHGAALRFAYRLGVSRQAGRWFVRWIGTQQPSGGRSQ